MHETDFPVIAELSSPLSLPRSLTVTTLLYSLLYSRGLAIATALSADVASDGTIMAEAVALGRVSEEAGGGGKQEGQTKEQTCRL